MESTKPFNQLGKDDAAIAGGKGASLGEMTQAGIPVPPGFVILADAFERFIIETELTAEIDAILEKVDHREMHTVEHASETIQSLILHAEMPADLKTEIEESFKDLNTEFVAVRSSATAEDGAEAAWAGQLDTFLNTTQETLLEKVRECWASLFTPRAIFYRFEKELDTQKISVAVVVQKMVNSDAAGIAFSVHPVTEDRNQMIIEAGFGLGEAVVSGQVTPDSYIVTKEPRTIIEKNISEQAQGIYRKAGGGNEWKDLPKEKGDSQVLTDKEILALAEVLIGIENHYGFPVDTEWAMEGEEMFIVQSRPITTLSSESPREDRHPEQVDWTTYLERKQPLFLFDSFIKPYGPLLKEVSGFGFTHQLHSFEKDVGVFYRSEHEMKQADEHFLSLIQHNDTRLHSWAKKGLEYNEIADSLIKSLSPKETLTREDIQTIVNEWESILLYSTVIPYRILSAVNSAIENGADKNDFHEVLELFEPLRGTTKYPQLIEAVFPKLWSFLAKDSNYGDENSLTCLLLDEVKGFLSGKELPVKEELMQRKEGSVFWLDEQTHSTIIQNNLRLLSEIGLSTTAGSTTELMGSVAEPGKATGIARIINDQSDITEFNDGDIVVSINTSPSLMPVLIKAGAIVTDEGGIMCHAAIISRELHKPCVIGTKIATKVIKNGDTVEVDANTGIVRIISTQETQIERWELSLQRNFPPFAISTSTHIEWKGFSMGSLDWKRGREIALRMKDENMNCFMNPSEYYVSNINAVLETINLDFEKALDASNALIHDGVRVMPGTTKEHLATLNEAHTLMYTLMLIGYDIAGDIKSTLEHTTPLTSELETCLSITTGETAVERERRAIQQAREGSMTVDELAQEFGYLHQDYLGKAWTKEEYAKVLAESSIGEPSREVFDLSSFTPHEQWLVTVFKKNLYLYEEGRNAMVRCAWALKETIAALGEDPEKLLYMRVDEVRDYANGSAGMMSDELYAARKEAYGVYFEGDTFVEVEGVEKVQKIIQEQGLEKFLEKKTFGEVTELKGRVAFKGHAKGKVRLVFTQKDADLVEEGDILVSPMTQVEFLSGLRKCGAIVTDEGGIVCHAAIVAREFSKPCILATKDATKVLKNGDMVEVDADNGIVRILDKEKELSSSKEPLNIHPEEWHHFGLWPQGVFSSCFWGSWFEKETFASMGLELDEGGVFIFNGGQFFYKKPIFQQAASQVAGWIEKGDETFFVAYAKKAKETYAKSIQFARTLSADKVISFEEFDEFLKYGQDITRYWCLAAVQLATSLEQILQEKVISHKLSAEIVPQLIPRIHTPLFEQQAELRELKQKIGSKSLDEIKRDGKLLKELEMHIEKYAWIEIANWVGDDLTLERLYTQLEHVKSELEPLPIEAQAPEEILLVARCLGSVGYAKQGGAEHLAIYAQLARPFLRKISAQIGITYAELMSLTHDEVRKALKGDLDARTLESRASSRSDDKWFVMAGQHNQYIFNDDKSELSRLVEVLLPEVDHNTKEFRGDIANAGKVRGIAKVIRNVDEFRKLQVGEVLVTTMTTPDFVILMQKAAAIVTDTGGLLSHAAIVSRELNKPCVIGTKIATQVLKDGDEVEVDADNGIVRILR